MIDIENVSHIYRTGFWLKPHLALRDLTLRIKEKSVFGFLGANGAGKTTLIHLLVGLSAPQTGAVRIDGIDATSALARAKVGYLPERPYFYPHLSGAEFLRLYGTLSGLTGKSLQSRILAVLRRVGLKGVEDKRLRAFSKGMLQRIGVAQALLHDPQVLILDEPMSGLDPLGRRELRELIVELASQGHTIFMSSHVIPDVEAICTEVALIGNGQLIKTGTIGELLQEGPTRIEVAFGSCTPEVARRWKVLDAGSELVWEVLPLDGIKTLCTSQESVKDLVQRGFKEGAQLLWVKPERANLEEYFFEGSRRALSKGGGP